MKKILSLSALLIMACLPLFAQTIDNPQVEHSDDMSSFITKIETNKQYTIVSFECTAHNENSWIQLNKEIFIQTDVDNKHYNYVKSENIVMVPGRHNFAKAGEKLLFTVYFEKIPQEAKSIDIIERAGTRQNGIGYFNYYNVSLTKSRAITPVTAANLMVPERSLDRMISRNETLNSGTNMMNIMNSMGPMFGNLTKSMMDAEIDYYKQPGKITEVARLNREYFDALVKQGFNEDQALKIITSESLLHKTTMGGK